MRVGAAMLIAGATLGACAPAEEGVLITIHTPDGNGFEPVGTLELFLGGDPDPNAGDRRIRQVLDDLGGDDLRPVDGELEGFTIFLQGIPSDVKIVAVAAFHDDPVEPEDFPVALGTMPIQFTPGELTSAELTLRGVNSGLNRQSFRWRGEPLAAPPLGHSCLAWTLLDGTLEQIVRADDYDCDGTLPIACSDTQQIDHNIPDDLPEQDRDGDNHFTCQFCTSPFTGRQVPCDCNDDPVNNGGAQNASTPEACDGIDNDCDSESFATANPDDYRPCLDPLPNSGCQVGVLGCDERLGDVQGDICRQVTTTQMEPCAIDLGGPTCATADLCQVTVIDPPQLIGCTSEYSIEGCGGSATIAELIENLDPIAGQPTVPVTCSAVLWGADDPVSGWSVRLQDATQTGVRAIRDQPCDTISVYVVGQSTTQEPFGVVVLVFDSETGERYSLPVSFESLNSGACSDPPMSCQAPL
jgi:hypothetical protein